MGQMRGLSDESVEAMWKELRNVRDERDSLKLQLEGMQKERDGLMILAELVWQSKSLLEAHQHFVAWRDKTGEFAEKRADDQNRWCSKCGRAVSPGFICQCGAVWIKR